VRAPFPANGAETPDRRSPATTRESFEPAKVLGAALPKLYPTLAYATNHHHCRRPPSVSRGTQARDLPGAGRRTDPRGGYRRLLARDPQRAFGRRPAPARPRHAGGVWVFRAGSGARALP